MANIDYELDPSTGSYADLYESNFPASCDLFEDKMDITSDLESYYEQWKGYMQAGNKTSADQIIENHPNLKKCITSAEDFNKMFHSIQAVERWVFYNIDQSLNEKINNELWLHDISIETGDWTLQSDGTYKYTYTRADIKQESIPQVMWDLNSKKIAMKMIITPVTYDGYMELIAEKSPRGALTIETLIIRNE